MIVVQSDLARRHPVEDGGREQTKQPLFCFSGITSKEHSPPASNQSAARSPGVNMLQGHVTSYVSSVVSAKKEFSQDSFAIDLDVDTSEKAPREGLKTFDRCLSPVRTLKVSTAP